VSVGSLQAFVAEDAEGLEEFLEEVRCVSAPVIGVVVNDMRSRSGEYGYGYGYGKHDQTPRSEDEGPTPDPVTVAE
jgi:hypothetical protein